IPVIKILQSIRMLNFLPVSSSSTPGSYLCAISRVIAPAFTLQSGGDRLGLARAQLFGGERRPRSMDLPVNDVHIYLFRWRFHEVVKRSRSVIFGLWYCAGRFCGFGNADVLPIPKKHQK